MNTPLGLRRTMLLIVLAPLLGATAVAVYQVRQLNRKAAELTRLNDVIAVVVDVSEFNILMGREYTDSWNMYLDANAGSTYQQHIAESERLVARIRENVSRMETASRNQNFAANIQAALKIYEQIPEIRAYYLDRRPGDDREARTVNNRAYTEIAAPLGAVVRSIVNESTELPIQLRIRTLILCADLHNNATTESGMYCWGHELGSYLTLANCAAPEFATQLRRDVQQLLLTNTVPELRRHFERVFADPVYVNADQAVRAFAQPDTVAKQRFDPAGLPAWRELSEKQRYALLVQLQPFVLDELQRFTQRFTASVKRERVLMVSLLSGVLLASGVAAYLTGRALFGTVARGVGSLQRSVANMVAGSEQTADAGAKMADIVAQQAAASEETASSLEELTATNRQNSEHARTVSARMQETGALVRRASGSMQQLVRAVEQISTTSGQTRHIASAIDEIAFQTNLLALNASIEAARAGEAGAGFAVVAEEVRRMAMRTATESASISQLIAGAHQLTTDGVTLSQRVEATFHDVDARTQAVAERMGEIQKATDKLVASVNEINATTRELDRSTQQNAAIAEENAATAGFIREQTAELTRSITVLGDLIASAAGDPAPALPIHDPEPEPAVPPAAPAVRRSEPRPEASLQRTGGPNP